MMRGLGRLTLSLGAAMGLAACVESQTPLLPKTQPLLGQEFDVHLYEDFVDGKALYFHATSYSWKDGEYVRSTQLARDVTSFVTTQLGENDFIIQATDKTRDNKIKVFDYWIGRKLVDGTYLIFPLDEADADPAIRGTACSKIMGPICIVETYQNLIELARATAAKPLRRPALAVIVSK